VLNFLPSSNGGKNGGYTLGKLVKLLGKTAPPVGDAIADAFNIANGFFPVKELPYPPTKLLVPLVLVELDIPLVPFSGILPFISVKFTESARYCSIL
jgi:hypothetical protein